jgi:hypothetical protein
MPAGVAPAGSEVGEVASSVRLPPLTANAPPGPIVQQSGSRPLAQGGEPGCDDGAQSVSQGQRLRGPPPASSGIVRDHLGQVDQRYGISGSLAVRPGQGQS